MTNDTKTFTYQARIPLDETQNETLSSYAALYGTVERCLFRDVCRSLNALSLKSDYLTEFGITARQFNGIRISLEGKIESAKQIRLEQIAQLKEKILSFKKKIPKMRNKRQKHQKTRKLASIELRLQTLEKERDEGPVSLCFGSKKLFRAQFALEENGYASFNEWKKEWEESRSSEIFCIGSKDETAGNQSCALTLDKEGVAALRVRIPDALASKAGKYLIIRNIAFVYGLPSIQKALQENRALSYRFKKDQRGWRVFISFVQERVPIVTREHIGAVGIDINVDHVALVETDAQGNPIYKETIPLSTYGKTKDQAKALIGDACTKIVSFAKEKKKPLVAEKLDFKKKKNTLKETLPKYARMLSSFHYSQLLQGLDAKCFKEGIEFYQVNPAMTSIIGYLKYSYRYGLSKHHAAALCIAHRHYQFSEAPTKSPIHTVHKNIHVTCPVPVRKRDQHVWKFWKDAERKCKAAHAAHFGANRSPCPS